MTQHAYAFDEPFWREPRRGLPLMALLSAATVVWMLIYAALGWRLWQNGALRIDAVSRALLVAPVLLGVFVALSWRMAWPEIRANRTTGRWRALTVAQMQQLTPGEFEEYVAQRLFARRGYIVLNTRDVKDGGIDVELTDAAGQRSIVQCKRYRDTVGEPTVRELYGTLRHENAHQAFLVTTASISDAAYKWAAGKPIYLIDGAYLEKLVK